MGITGKYDFKGIKKYGAQGLLVALSSTAWGAFLMKWGFQGAFEISLQWLTNWLANQGLIVFNIGAMTVENEFDQKAFDREMNKALAEVELKNVILSPAQQKAIDDKVIEAFRKFAVISK